MKKYIMNKNVMHDGKHYVKGEELSKEHAGFESLVAQGHADELSFKAEHAHAEEPNFPEESEKHSKKHGRK